MTEEEDQKETLAVDPNAPKIRVVRPTIVASEGSVATLSVQVSGYPNPDVYWRKGRQDLDTRRGKYQILSGGTLQVRLFFIRLPSYIFFKPDYMQKQGSLINFGFSIFD